MYNILVDENIPFASEAFSSFGNVTRIPGNEFTPQNIQDHDILIIRSVTRINEELLSKSKVKFVGTATIGTDHIDTEYLLNHNIEFASAKGCNSQSVAEYVFSGIFTEMSRLNRRINGTTLGIIGLGNIGSKVLKMAEEYGFKVLVNDPPLAEKGLLNNNSDLNKVLGADIITLHVPLIKEGKNRTYHLINENNLFLINEGAVFINSSRGAVVDNSALLNNLETNKTNVVLDVWENEPTPDIELVKKVNIGTPHIAGYSVEGKANGTKMIYDALCKFLEAENNWTPVLPVIEDNLIKVNSGLSKEEQLYSIFNSVYNIYNDSKLFKQEITETQAKTAEKFNLLRRNYPVRRELSNYKIIYF
jgi:erythronate-4-phosphate dehydrogenase